jgi:chromosome segregation ATPase
LKGKIMKKLSENLQALADHVAELEKKVSTAEMESKEKVEARIEASKADAKARQEEFKAKVNETKADVASQWEDLQTDYNRQVAQIKSKIEAKKEARELNRAVNRADDAEDYAATSIAFAIMAVDDAEIAALEAIDARAYADSLA